MFCFPFRVRWMRWLVLIVKEFSSSKDYLLRNYSKTINWVWNNGQSNSEEGWRKLSGSDFEFEFLAIHQKCIYGKESSLWKETRNIFSDDLIFGMGEARGKIRNGNWKEEISNITQIKYQIQKRLQLQQSLSQLNPAFAAVGHGPCLKFNY